jgi:hypothetical protein
MKRRRLAPNRSEDRLMVKELAHLFEGDELPIEAWQIEEEIPLSRMPPPLRPALVLAGGRTETLDTGFDWFESIWFATA